MGTSQSAEKIHELTTIAHVRTAYPSYKTSDSTPELDQKFHNQYYGWHLGYPEIDHYLYKHPEPYKKKEESESGQNFLVFKYRSSDGRTDTPSAA